MALDQEKYNLLSQHGFINHFNRSAYFSRQLRKFFSLEAIEDHGFEWLRERVESPNTTQTWQFYFNQPPSQEILREILKEFGE
ncbi:MAG: hypothetical protein ABSB63_02210 [Spirochaetia bacterium]|jgi:hypothetical protein